MELQVQNAIESTGYYDEEFTTIGIEDRKLRRVRSIAKVLYDEGIPVKLAGIIIETTKPEVAQPLVPDKNFQLKLVADTMPQLVWTTFPNGEHDFFNRRWYEYVGLNYEQIRGEGWSAVLNPDDLDHARKLWEHCLQTGEPYEVEYRIKRFDGQYRWFLARALPLKDENGNIVKWYGTCTDIHDQKTASEMLEKRVKERTRELEIRNRELEQFTFVSHHDLQEPLRKILTFSSMIRSESYNNLTVTSQNWLNKITDTARKMRTVLLDVLNFASLDKKEEFVFVDLQKVMANVRSDLELVILEKSAELNIDRLPSICGVPGQMHQLFYNLMNNALKFTKPGERSEISVKCRLLSAMEVKVQSKLEQAKAYYEITMQDNGIGFDQQEAEMIFGMFQRLHCKDAYAGTGIGLALCKKVVHNHGGLIWAESKEGAGAIFKIILPVQNNIQPPIKNPATT